MGWFWWAPRWPSSPPPGEPASGTQTVTGEGAFDWQVLEIHRGVRPDLALDAQDRAHLAYGLERKPGFVMHSLVGDATALLPTVVQPGGTDYPSGSVSSPLAAVYTRRQRLGKSWVVKPQRF